jgi:DNA-directed RNA polymerase subunit beta
MAKKDFSKSRTFLEIPDLLSIQKESFFDFLQCCYDPADQKMKVRPAKDLKSEGLLAVFNEVFPIVEPHKGLTLEFVSYDLGEPKYSPHEALIKGVTYAVPLKAVFRMIHQPPEGFEARRPASDEANASANDGDSRSAPVPRSAPSLRDIPEQEVFFCEMPFMTDQGTFIINGVERVVVSQLQRSPGLYFAREGADQSALLVPLRGAWLEFVVDKHNAAVVLLDRKRRIPAATFLRALGYSHGEMMQQLVKTARGKPALGQVVAETVTADDEILASPGDPVTDGLLSVFADKDVKEITYAAEDTPGVQTVSYSLRQDRALTQDDAIRRIYYRLRSIAPHSIEVAKSVIHGMLFDRRKFDLGRVGRYKLNQRLGTDISLDETGLRHEDLMGILRLLLDFADRGFQPDDADHLANRRVKRVGELLENQFRLALMQLSQSIRERAAFVEDEQLIPQELVNTRVISNAVMKFFTQNQLCQFMEQTNPLTDLTHRRRISALGPGGLTKETAGFEVRDVHYSHYGRICPIETPEGPNIGLISTAATYARIDEYGFITTPYWKVKDGLVTGQKDYLNPEEEDQKTIAQANTEIDAERRIVRKEVICRRKGDIITVPVAEVEYMDVSPKQIFAPSTVMVPFLEHDDADRALMGANMQRQAVPLLKPEKPLVGTGVEGKFARESGAVLVAQEQGEVSRVDARRILVRTETGFHEHVLRKFLKSNQYTCLNQTPLVREGQKVRKGTILADGSGTQDGELALGRNVFVAFLPWRGYNYEDAVVVSERVLREDMFTSIQILEFDVQARETRLGPEEITRDIPGATEDELRDLDEFGIVRVGAEVSAGDILAGRITPKAETEFTPEERLLRAIFGEKAANVRDTSLRVDPGVAGIIIERRVFSRKLGDALSRRLEEEKRKEADHLYELAKRFAAEKLEARLKTALLGHKADINVRDNKGKVVLKSGEAFGEEFFRETDVARLRTQDGLTGVSSRDTEVSAAFRAYDEALTASEVVRKQEHERVLRGDELPYGVNRWIRIFIAQKRRLAVGDKMAGRHGNKGVVAKVLPVEEMPYLADGTPVDVVLNPLGVPSRMNIGQLLEVHLGWAADKLGYEAVCPVFEGATPEEISSELDKAGLPRDGKVDLFDGRTGLPFGQKVTVGRAYLMKLIHMVDDKIHARSTGRYSLITQQPLGGKAQFGGQRFGEMEVWALEAYGAAHVLQEILTIKSDDVDGRSALYEALIRGKNPPQPKAPASFSVLIRELQGLGLELIPEKT